MRPRRVLSIAIFGVRKTLVALPARADACPRTLTPAATAAQRTAEGTTAAPVPALATAKETVTGAPAFGFFGEIANPRITGLAAAATTSTVRVAWLLEGFGSVAVSSVSWAVRVYEPGASATR